MLTEAQLERLIAKIDVQPDPAACWEWMASTSRGGYGQFNVGTKHGKQSIIRRAPRVVYECFVGPIPDGLHLDHLCRNPKCVNPDHLEPVTNRENTRRGKALITECPHGHPYDDENTYVSAQGWRDCRACAREYQREQRRAAA